MLAVPCINKIELTHVETLTPVATDQIDDNGTDTLISRFHLLYDVILTRVSDPDSVYIV